MKKTAGIIKIILLAFVLISIGFAFVKHFNAETVKTANSINLTNAEHNNLKSRVVIHVYYLHSTFRCITCNTIEKMTKQLLDKDFSKEMKDKKIIFSEANFQLDENLAKKFKVVSSCVVVAVEENGKILGFKRLDEVWTLLDKHTDFNNYISQAVNDYLINQNYKMGTK
jgi:hypothetical protein